VADLSREHPIRSSQCAGIASIFLLIAAAFYVFTYNSGYGYDACEYLVIGQSLLDGFRISTFVLSKGWAVYVMSALALQVLPASNHAWIAGVITLLFALAVAGTWWVGRDLFGKQVAAWSALLVAACAFFMELNFLEPEIPVYLCGILAVHFIEVSRMRPAVRCALAGACLGLGCAFKAVALFYLAAICGYLFFNSKRPAMQSLRDFLWILSGFAIAIAIPAGYFAATGQLQHHVGWSFVFPLLHYPSSTFWAAKLYTKLLWFFLALAGAFLMASRRPLRHKIFVNPRVSLVIWLGCLSLLSLFKTQSSHYVFPGAAFLSFFIAQTACSWWSLQESAREIPVWLPLATLVLMAVSAYLYNPSAFARFVRIRDFSEDTRIAARLETLAHAQDRVLFLHGGMALYWLAHRYPNVPFIHTDVQITYILSQQPELLTAALDDPALKLVEFDPDHLDFDDPRFLAAHRNLIRQFYQHLQERFRRIQEPDLSLNLWVPKA